MTRPFPPVEAVPMEPGGREYCVIPDNAKTPAYDGRVFAENLSESEARYIAVAVNSMDLLKRLYNACMVADANEELSESIDGLLLDECAAALSDLADAEGAA